MPSFSFASNQSQRPPALAPAHHSMTSRSSTARDSIYSQGPETTPLLPTFTIDVNEKGIEGLKYHGEQIWEPQSQASSAGGERTATKHQRGCEKPRADVYDQARWKKRVQDIIGHKFNNVDILEEALESAGSGVTVVGASARQFSNGNRDLAQVGHNVMTLVLNDQCYLFCVHEDDAKNSIDNLINDDALHQLGMTTRLQQYIRPRAPLRPSQKWHIWANIKDDFKGLGKDSPRVVAAGIKAIIGAVYYDAGYESARRTIVHLGIIIKLPHPKPAPEP